MTTTLTQIQSCWVTSSQAALSTMDAAASQPMARCRGSARLGGQPLVHGEAGQPEVDRGPDREGRAGRGDERRVGRERAPGRLRHAGADHPDADQGADHAEQLGDGDRDLAQAVGGRGVGPGERRHAAIAPRTPMGSFDTGTGGSARRFGQDVHRIDAYH